MRDDLYMDIQKEMERDGTSFSAVISRRLTKLAEIEKVEPK